MMIPVFLWLLIGRDNPAAAGWLLLREVGALLVGPGGVGLDSWTPLPIDEPGEGRVDLVVGHPDHGEWLESLARCAFSDE